MDRGSTIRTTSNALDAIAIASLAQPALCAELVGRAPVTRAMFATIERLAPYKGTVLVTGRSGSGKELVAQALHQMGPFADGPLVTFNCSNLVAGLAEAQLFGHVKGAFTDAREAHIGCFRQAHGGTLLLDEVGELPLAMQAKLLRVAESFEVQPVGSAATTQVELRLLAATNRDLPAMVKAGQFRADLYYRLDVASIKVPPLCDRSDDVPLLTAHFAARYERSLGKQVRTISRRALATLGAYQWPGNIRELAHVIERAIILDDDERIDLDDLPEPLLASSRTESLGAPAGGGVQPLDNILKETVERSLFAARGDCAAAARLLGISRPAIYRKMARFGIANTAARTYRSPLAGRDNTIRRLTV